MVTYLLDTNTCIAALRQHRPLLARMMRFSPDEMAVAAMTVGELWFGALKSRDPARGRAVTDAFLAPFDVLAFDEAAAETYATARRDLELRGTPIGERDLIIAAIARAHSLIVVTSNTREFERVKGLEVEDWGEG